MTKKNEESRYLGPRGIAIKKIIFGEVEKTKSVGTRIPLSEEKEWIQFKKICYNTGFKASDLFLIMLKQNNRDYETIIPIADELGYDPVKFYNEIRENLRNSIGNIDDNLEERNNEIQKQVLNDINRSVKISIK